MEFFKETILVIATAAIPFLVLVFLGAALWKKVKVYDTFIDGAKEGFSVAVRIIPYLVGMLVAIGVFRASGALELLVRVIDPLGRWIGMPAEALPMILMRPLSGSGSLGLMSDIMKTYGPDSFIGVLVSTIYGSSETTFYVIAVYFGAVGIKNTRHAIAAGLMADVAGALAALFVVKMLFR
jgi:spore maturation protein B